MSLHQTLTKRLVDAAKPQPGRYIIWDSGLAGFGLRVEPTGRKTFIARYRAGGGRSGTLRQATIGRYGILTPDHARVLARKILGAAADGRDPVEEKKRERKPGITVSQVCNWYLEQAEAGRILGRKGRSIKASTLAMDRSRIETHVKPLIGKKAVQDLTADDVEEMQADIAAGKTAKPQAGKVRGKKQKQLRGGIATGGNSVAARSLGMVRTIFEHARRKRLIAENPAKGARKLADQKRKVRLTLDQVRLLGKALSDAVAEGDNPTGLAIIRFIILSGFRRHEALTIQRAWLLDAGGVDFPDTKSGAQVRPLGRAAINVLRAQRARGEGNWIFPADQGGGHFVGVRKVLGRVCKRAGLEDVTPHVLRHTFASVAGDLGYSELTIAGLLGHASGSTTAAYVHLDAALVTAADRVAAVIAAALEDKPVERVPGRPD
ncbi:MAG: integrase arm-type DNA-binding domain-containing protein [Methyloceanibacter sp.]